MNSITEEKRVQLIRIVVALFFAIGILMSWRAWGADRLFPLCPLFDFMPFFTIEVANVFAGTLVLLLLVAAFYPKRGLIIVLFTVLLFLLLQDQMRWQPWVYVYSLLLLPFLFTQKMNDSRLLSYFQILIIGVYLWSGLYKFNAGFVEITFDRMLYHLFFIENETTRQGLLFIGYIIPVIEVGMAILLFFSRTRKIGVFLALGSHIIILAYLIIPGHNSIVYPWNVAMMILVVLLFYKTSNKISLFNYHSWRIKLLTSFGAVLFLIMPAFASLKLWDNYLSFKLYSGTNGIFCVAIDQDQVYEIDPQLMDYFYPVQRIQGKYWIYVNKWAIEELNVTFYPELRTFEQVATSFCDSNISENKIRFYRFDEDFDTGPFVEFGCTDL